MVKTITSDRSEFLRAVKAVFPQIRDGVNMWSGLLHLEVSEFCRLVQAAIESGDHGTVRTAFELVADHFERGRPALRNALAVSFLEHLNFEDGRAKRRWAYELLPLVLRDVLRSLNPEHPPNDVSRRAKTIAKPRKAKAQRGEKS